MAQPFKGITNIVYPGIYEVEGFSKMSLLLTYLLVWQLVEIIMVYDSYLNHRAAPGDDLSNS